MAKALKEFCVGLLIITVVLDRIVCFCMKPLTAFFWFFLILYPFRHMHSVLYTVFRKKTLTDVFCFISP